MLAAHVPCSDGYRHSRQLLFWQQPKHQGVLAHVFGWSGPGTMKKVTVEFTHGTKSRMYNFFVLLLIAAAPSILFSSVFTCQSANNLKEEEALLV
jgi:hypothetical protein